MEDGWLGIPWGEVGSVAAASLAIYVSAVAALRLAGRRTVSQMSAFDFVVTIAIGSIVAATAMSPGSTYLRGIVALATLLAAQQAVAVLRQRFPSTRRFLDFSPQPLYRGGRVELRQSPLTAQVTDAELYGKLRQAGVSTLDDVTLVILEPDGKISILQSDQREAIADLWERALMEEHRTR